MALRDEQSWFESNRAYIAQQYPSQWVLVKNLQVQGAFPSYKDAFDAGVKQFGVQGEFLVKQALAKEPTYKIGSVAR